MSDVNAQYQLSLFRASPEPACTVEHHCAGDTQAIAEARRLLVQLVGQGVASVGLGRVAGGEVEWLGAWDWDSAPRWRPPS